MSRIRRLQHRIDRLDGAASDMPRVSRGLSQAALVGMWALVTIYDAVGDPGALRALLPLVGLTPMFVRILRPSELHDDGEVYHAYVRLTLLTLVMLFGFLVAGLLPFSFAEEGQAEGTVNLLVARFAALAPLLTIPPIAETLLTVQRYRSRRSVPRTAILMAYGLILAVVIEQVFPTGTLPETEPTTPAAVMAGLLGFGAFILSLRARWIVNLRKRQKLAMLGMTTIGMPISFALIALHDGSGDLAVATFTFFPGLSLLGFSVGIALAVTQFTYFAQVLMSLPTAEAIDRRAAEISSLATFGRLLTRSFDMRDLVDTSLAVTCDVTGGLAAWIDLAPDAGGGERLILYGSAPRIAESDARELMLVPVDGSPLETAVRRSGSLQLVDGLVARRADAAGGAAPAAAASVAAAPLIAGESMLGTIYVIKGRDQEFDREDLAFLKTVADQIALSIEHSRLIANSIERERIEQEMLIARDLQVRLLPRAMPQSPWFDIAAESRPADLVGGDYYDLVSFSDGTLGVVIGDVSGKGASAALYMGMIKGVIQAFSGSTSDPRELLSKVNVALHGQIDQKWFATMTCAQIVEHRRTLNIARAGHCPTLIVRSHAGSYLRSKGIGLALARPLLFERHLELDEVHFSSDDYVVFFSDGLPESRSPEGEEFGYDRLLDAAVRAAALDPSPTQLREAIFTELSAFTRGEQPGDDTTIVVLRWRTYEATEETTAT